ncbi:1231_t:CDS:2, partial [Racocetra persica]
FSKSILLNGQISEVTNGLLENATLMVAKPKKLVSKDRLMKFKEGVNLQRLDRISYEPTLNWNQDTVLNKRKYSSFTIHYTIDSPIHRTTIKNTFEIPERASLEELLSHINKQQTATSSFEATSKKFYYENTFNQKIMIVDEEDWKLAKWERKRS